MAVFTDEVWSYSLKPMMSLASMAAAMQAYSPAGISSTFHRPCLICCSTPGHVLSVELCRLLFSLNQCQQTLLQLPSFTTSTLELAVIAVMFFSSIA